MRRNPFNRQSIIDLATLPQSPIRAPPIPPKVSKDNRGANSQRRSISIDGHEIEPSTHGLRDELPLADGYDEYIKSFGSQYLAQTTSSRTCDFFLPVKWLLGVSISILQGQVTKKSLLNTGFQHCPKFKMKILKTLGAQPPHRLMLLNLDTMKWQTGLTWSWKSVQIERDRIPTISAHSTQAISTVLWE